MTQTTLTDFEPARAIPDGGRQACDGCHDPKPADIELRTFRMEYGGVETLCPECIRQSHSIIDHEVQPDGGQADDCWCESSDLACWVHYQMGDDNNE